ncbi:hypothetical protein [Defluviimonas salinarum]|uniref:General secretion pathway protein GspC n=1 Tax=Defluviimonas salinarum TaxID=2992147 RepID=A0ABT3J784_9RHOB|nr:hypothetical protein [Defluviimonas salinarum]MCW3783542.1 hypothetical protein [Defluviimonas salinarum]
MTRLLPVLGTALLVILTASSWIRMPGNAADTRLKAITAPSLEANEPETDAAPATGPVARPAVYYSAILQRPLFEPGRRPLSPDRGAEPEENAIAEPAPAVTDNSAPGVILLGILRTGAEDTALIAIDGQAPEWIAQGAAINDWVIATISNDWIEMTNSDRTVRVDMYQ